MANNSCTITPQVNGKDSKLYRDILKRVVNRPQTNWIYASYKASNMASVMTQQGYMTDANGEHRAYDVLKVIDFNAIQNEIGSLSDLEKQLGAVDQNGNRVDFVDAKEAYEKAEAFNNPPSGNPPKGLVANVVKHGTGPNAVYNVILYEKNSRTHTYGMSVTEKLRAWDVYKQVFSSIGVDIENMPQELRGVFSVYNTDLVQQLINLKNSQINFLYKEGALTLLMLNQNQPFVQRVRNSFGSLDAAAQAIDDINHGNINVSSAQMRLLMNAINQAQQFNGLDLDALKTQIDQMTQQIKNANPEEAIRNELHQLNKKYKIDINEIHRVNNKIKSLSDAAAEAAVQLNRQIKQLEKEKGNNTQGKNLEIVLNQLMKELECKRYYSGVLNFLNVATSQAAQINPMLNNLSQTGTEMDKAFEAAKILQKIKDLKDQYYLVASALADDHLVIDENISQTDIDNIRNIAKQVKEFFDKEDKEINDLTEKTMTTLLTQIIGPTTPDGIAIINAIKMAAADSSIFDYLYSIGRASNPIIGAMGSIIRRAQGEREGILNEISRRIRRENDILLKAKKNSKYMYEDDGHIISDIDWTAYSDARKKYVGSLLKQGLQGFDLKQAIEDWEEQNTEDRVVDTKNGRTERVPNANYRKNNGMIWDDVNNKMKFYNTGLSQEQIDYYNNMMQLKGEIGSLLPAYAQRQYLAPQIRRNMLDALNEAKSLHDVGKAFKNKAQNLYKVREDDENYAMNGIIDGVEFRKDEGDFDNTPLRQIPIFYINKVEEGELLRDFATGLQHLAGTAVNYNAMSGVVDVVEFIGDFAKNQLPKDPKNRAEILDNKTTKVVNDLYRWGKRNSNTSDIIDGFIAYHIYGERRDPNEAGKWWEVTGSKIIAYTSFKGLATNIKGAFSNYLVGEFQMLIEAGCGEFYGFKDYLWAHTKLFGKAGVGGEIAELLTNNMNHKATLFREMFDPIQENFSDKSHQRYYNSMFRQLLGHDCAFIGYASGEYLIHYVNMYAILNNQKVFKNGKAISLYDAFTVKNKQNGNSELIIDPTVTIGAKVNGKWVDTGNAVTDEWLQEIKNKIRYANQSTHGSMNAEDKGLIHRYLLGRAVMNFRQWMIEHYSRRFRKRHFDESLGMEREGYWRSLYQGVFNEDFKDAWKDHQFGAVMGMFMRDLMTFTIRGQVQWAELDEMQRYNIKRAHSEVIMYLALLGLSFALGEPDKHKKEAWRRWWIYQVRRLILDTEASMPIPSAVKSGITILQSPIGGVDTLNGLLYAFTGWKDMGKTIQSGPHKGENRWWRNIKKYDFPFFKDWEQMQQMDEDDSIFKIFENSPSRY